MVTKLLMLMGMLLVLTQCTPSRENTLAVTDSVEALPPETSIVPYTYDTLGTEELSGADYEDELDLSTYLVTTPVEANETLMIDSACAVAVFPNDQQIKAMIDRYGEEDFATIADDNTFYQSQALMCADSASVKTVMLKTRYVKLVDGARSWTLDFRKDAFSGWALIFFKPGKEPEVVYMVDITTEKVNAFFQ